MGPAEQDESPEGISIKHATASFCKPKLKRLLVLLVIVLVFGQLSLNMLFYRNSDSLFYINTTTLSSTGPALMDSQLWWTSSPLPWVQPLPISQPHNSSSPASMKKFVEEERGVRHGNQEDMKTNPMNVEDEKDSVRILTSKAYLAEFTGGPTNHSITKLYPKIATKKYVTTERSSIQESVGDTVVKATHQSTHEHATHTAPKIEKQLCPPVPPNLVGVVKVCKKAPSLEEQERSHPELAPGGHYQPENCKAHHKVAIIIPYRDRVSHLAILIHHLHPILQRQQVDYTIFVVEQAGSGRFNRAMLMNVGALEALKHYPFNCFIFHDVDLLLEDDRNLYTCPEQPRHMSIAIDTMKYRLPYNDIFGGVSAMTVEQFQTVNGFSNKYWGWGGEDDDMSNRIKHHGLFISRYPANVGRYTMLTHKKDSPNPRRYQNLVEGKKRYNSDGLSSVKYRTLDTQLRRLYTWVYVDLFPS